MENIERLQPRAFTKFCMSIGMVPSSYTSALTYEEQLLWFCSYLEKEVIPAVNNNAEAVTELQGLYTQLKDYVDHYFENLDVQEEINNKLDDMAESGELADIIAQYIQLQGILAYNSVADMKAAENLVAGSFAETYGYYSNGDGGNAKYKIRQVTNQDTEDDMFIVALSDENLVAELIIDQNLNLKQLGVKADGETDETDKLQTILSKCKTINGCEGTLIISEPIVVSLNHNDEIHYDFKNLTIKVDSDSTINKVLEFRTEQTNDRFYGEIKNLNIDSNGLSNNGLELTRSRVLTLNNVNIKNSLQKEFYTTTVNTSVLADKMILTCGYNEEIDECLNAYAMYITSSDSHFTNIVTNGYLKHIYNSGTNFFDKIHSWNWLEGTIDNSLMFDNNGGHIISSDCYCDTLQTMFKCTGVGLIDCVNPLFWENPDFYTSENQKPTPIIVDTNFINNYGKIRITNGRFGGVSGLTGLEFINYPTRPATDVRLTLLRLENVNTGNYYVSPYFLDYKAVNIDLGNDSGFYINNCVIDHGNMFFKFKGNIDAPTTRDAYVTIATIQNDDIVIKEEQSFFGYISPYSNTAYVLPILCKINTNKTIQIRVPTDASITGGCFVELTHQTDLGTNNNMYN